MSVERLGIADMERRLGLDRKTISNWVKAGKLPAPHYLGEVRRWFTADIERWERDEMRADRPRRRLARPTTPGIRASSETDVHGE